MVVASLAIRRARGPRSGEVSATVASEPIDSLNSPRRCGCQRGCCRVDVDCHVSYKCINGCSMRNRTSISSSNAIVEVVVAVAVAAIPSDLAIVVAILVVVVVALVVVVVVVVAISC